MSGDSYRIIILGDQAQERLVYRKHLTDYLEPSFQIDEINSIDLEQQLSQDIADCILVVQPRLEQKNLLLSYLSTNTAQEHIPGVIFIVHPEILAARSIQSTPSIEFITPDEASPYRLVQAIQRLIERRDILKRIDEYTERLVDVQEVLDQLWDDIVGPALIFDMNGVVKRVNAPFLKLTQEIPDHFIGHGYMDFLPSMNEDIFQERVTSILGAGSGMFWSGKFDADRQPQYPLRFSARVTGPKEKPSRFMVLVEPELTELPATTVEPVTLMQHMDGLMQRYDAQMNAQTFYEYLIHGAQEAMQAAGAAIFSFNALEQEMVKESMQGTLPVWIIQTEKHSKEEYLFRDAIADLQVKAFKLASTPEQIVSMLVTVPMIIQQRVLGGLCLSFEEVRPLSTDERCFLNMFGTWAAQMLECHHLTPCTNTDIPAIGTTAELLRSRNDVLPVIAHELRTPLTVLMGYVQLLQRRLRTGSILEERNLRALHTILDRAQRVDNTLETLIELARIDMGAFSIITQPVNVSLVLRDVLLALRRETAHTLIFEGLEQAMVMGDEARLRRVFSSIIHNAMMYSPPSGVVTVRVKSKKDMIHILVSDEGEGIHSEQISDAFKRFSHVRTGRSMGGMGVSLYLARKIIEAHNGTISMTSTPGLGSQVVIELPKLIS